MQQVRTQRRPAPKRMDEPPARSRKATASDTTAADQILAQIEAVLAEA